MKTAQSVKRYSDYVEPAKDRNCLLEIDRDIRGEKLGSLDLSTPERGMKLPSLYISTTRMLKAIFLHRGDQDVRKFNPEIYCLGKLSFKSHICHESLQGQLYRCIRTRSPFCIRRISVNPFDIICKQSELASMLEWIIFLLMIFLQVNLVFWDACRGTCCAPSGGQKSTILLHISALTLTCSLSGCADLCSKLLEDVCSASSPSEPCEALSTGFFMPFPLPSCAELLNLFRLLPVKRTRLEDSCLHAVCDFGMKPVRIYASNACLWKYFFWKWLSFESQTEPRVSR